jgi:hypothetical protein
MAGRRSPREYFGSIKDQGSLNLGALYAGQGRLDEARAAFQAAADSDDPEARQMADRRLAVLAERAGGTGLTSS